MAQSRCRTRRATTSVTSDDLRQDDAKLLPGSLSRGASIPSDLAQNGRGNRRSHRRPKSEYGCIRSASELPCFNKSQASTPSDGDSDIIEYQKSPSRTGIDGVENQEKTSPGRNFLTRLLSLNRSRSRDRHKKGSRASIETQHLLSSASVAESLCRSENSQKDGERGNSAKADEDTPEIEVKIQHYRSLSPTHSEYGKGSSCPTPSASSSKPLVLHNDSPGPCPTPPMAIFSSDEDISSVPHTPRKKSDSVIRHTSKSATSEATECKEIKQLTARLVEGRTQPVSMVVPEVPPRTISPQLEQQISRVFTCPQMDTGCAEEPTFSTKGVSIRKHSLASSGIPESVASTNHSASRVKRRPKYSRRKHYTIDFSSLPTDATAELDALENIEPPMSNAMKRRSMDRQTSLQALLCGANSATSPDLPPDSLPQSEDVLPRLVNRTEIPSRPSSASRVRSSSRTRGQVSGTLQSHGSVPVLHGNRQQISQHSQGSREGPVHSVRYCRAANSQGSLLSGNSNTCSRLARSYSSESGASGELDSSVKAPRRSRNSSGSRERRIPVRKLSDHRSPLDAVSSLRGSSDLLKIGRDDSRTSEPLKGGKTSTGASKVTTANMERLRRHSASLRTSGPATGKEDESETSDQLPLLMAEVASNDSGIQQDETPTSCESFKLQSHLENLPLIAPLRPSTVESPRRPKRDRPKSDCLTVRWADSPGGSTVQSQSNLRHSPEGSTLQGLPSQCYTEGGSRDGSVQVRRTRGNRGRERPKSDIGSFHGLSDALQTLMRRDRMNSSSSLLTAEGLADSRHNIRSRRMSTPQPIRSRQTRSTSTRIVPARPVIRRSRSAPDLADPDEHRSRRRDVFRMSSSTAGDLALQPHDFSSDEDSEDCVSYGAGSITGSTTSLRQQTTLEEIFEDHESPTYTEALWDHVTMDTEELGFRAGDVIEVLDLEDRDWWFGRMGDKRGWFPSAFVRMRANQVELVADGDMSTAAGSSGHLMLLATDSVSQTQARTNVVREILHAEREYVRHLKDVMQGYVEKCRKRPEMFPETTMSAIFGNIGAIHSFSTVFLRDLENHVLLDQPHQSNLGQVFIKHSTGFEIYSEYCNNHPTACEELRTLTKNKKYTHFFEACRLLQDMIELPLEGFLLTPVQKICKYPLQLKELLKYTPPTHPDYAQLTAALETMRRIAMMINERKRKMESLEKLSSWQRRIEDWQGPNLLDQSSELIYSGEMTKVNNSGWHQDRVFFLFDHQLIYCKKDMLWRDLLIYKGRINLDNCIIKALPDEKDPVFNVHVKNGIRIYDNEKSKWYLVYCRTAHDRSRWFRAFQQERHRVEEDADNDFNLEEFRRKLSLSSHGKGQAHPSARYRERTQKQRKKHRGRRTVYAEASRQPPAQTSPPTMPQPEAESTESNHAKRWFNFGNKKNKR